MRRGEIIGVALVLAFLMALIVAGELLNQMVTGSP